MPRLRRLPWAPLVVTACASSRPTPPTTDISRSRAPVDAYADLTPLGDAIGSAEVVALGEPTHANGNIDATNARLIAFLHERLGFTVLAWEAGLFSCETDPAHCLGWPWGAIEEMREVRSLTPASGIHVTGFDLQFTGVPREASVQRLQALISRALESNLGLIKRLDVAFGRFPKYKYFAKLTAVERAGDRDAFREALAALAGRSDVPDVALVMRAVENVIGLYEWHEAVGADVSTVIDWAHKLGSGNVRDRVMAENLLWLHRVRYPGQKIIMWLANMHAARHAELVVESRGPEFSN